MGDIWSGSIFREISGQLRFSNLGDIRTVQIQYLGDIRSVQVQYFARYPASPGSVLWEISGHFRFSILGDIRSVQVQYFVRYQVSSGSVC